MRDPRFDKERRMVEAWLKLAEVMDEQNDLPEVRKQEPVPQADGAEE